MKHLIFSRTERILSFMVGLINSLVGLGFFFLPELRWPIWPASISPILTRFIGAIILGNAAGALLLSTEREWVRVRALALVAIVYGTLVALALLYHLIWLHANPVFWLYFCFDAPFLVVYYALFLYHDFGSFRERRAPLKTHKMN